MSDIKFIDGFNVFKPNDNAPDFVKADVSIDLKKFFEFAKGWKAQNPDEQYLKIQVLESKAGKYYGKENDYKPRAKEPGPDFDDDIPFS